MVIVVFLVIYKAKNLKFFKEIFLVPNISFNAVFKMFFFILNSTNTDFAKIKF